MKLTPKEHMEYFHSCFIKICQCLSAISIAGQLFNEMLHQIENLGPVVQSIVNLTKLLVENWVGQTVLSKSIVIFLLKNCKSSSHFRPKMAVFLAHLSTKVLMVSYCDQSLSVVRRASSVVNNLF